MTSLVLSILNGSSSYLQIKRTAIKAWISLIDNVVTTLAPSS